VRVYFINLGDWFACLWKSLEWCSLISRYFQTGLSKCSLHSQWLFDATCQPTEALWIVTQWSFHFQTCQKVVCPPQQLCYLHISNRKWHPCFNCYPHARIHSVNRGGVGGRHFSSWKGPWQNYKDVPHAYPILFNFGLELGPRVLESILLHRQLCRWNQEVRDNRKGFLCMYLFSP